MGAEAESDEARGKAEIAKDKLSGREKVHKIRNKDKSKLTDEERAIIEKDNERLAKEEETLKLDFVTKRCKRNIKRQERAPKPRKSVPLRKHGQPNRGHNKLLSESSKMGKGRRISCSKSLLPTTRNLLLLTK